LSKEAAKVMK